jgi:hypothetical protein
MASMDFYRRVPKDLTEVSIYQLLSGVPLWPCGIWNSVVALAVLLYS